MGRGEPITGIYFRVARAPFCEADYKRARRPAGGPVAAEELVPSLARSVLAFRPLRPASAGFLTRGAALPALGPRAASQP